MSRRLGILATAILLLFAVVAAQAINVQFFRAPSLNASPQNPRVNQATTQYPRGEIIAADGTILAQSRPSKGYYQWRRIYPLGSLTSGVIGFASPSYGTWGLENEYDSELTAHPQPPQSFEQLLAPTSAANSVTLTLEPALQSIARNALLGRDGAAVVLDPRTGAVLAMYSNPTYNPVPLTSPTYTVAQAAWKRDTTNNAHGFPPLGLVATQQTFPPGSTFKIVTTAGVVAYKPSLLQKSYPVVATIKLPQSNKTLSNFGFVPCGGKVSVMLPVSCDPGYALLGLDLGGALLAKAANAFGYNSTPPLDFPNVVPSYFPPASSFLTNLPGVAYSAIGQQNVRATALQQALLAATIANGGTTMSPHFLAYVSSPEGTVVKRYVPTAWQHPLTPAQAGQIVPLMVDVAKYGTAAGWFPAADEVGAKTGTAQTGNSAKNTDDWMIAFAPASHPTVAIAVVVPFQSVSGTGSAVAGPIMKCLIEGTLALQAGQPATGTATTCPR
ncbi:MAG TPA: penicillin-binding transpeptidase domain-containing protein [Acidimicrobiales bacterium]|nr:penicillin-binding transpeptidase domain-containing protein [Acidimicrobiales bacterium]